MPPVKILLSKGKWSSKHSVLSFICFYVLDEPFHEVLQFSTIYLMVKPQPFASVVVPLSTICEYRLPAVPSSQLLEEVVAYKNRPFPLEVHH